MEETLQRDFHALTAEETLKHLEVHEEGLSTRSFYYIRRGHEDVAVCVPCMREIVQSHLNKL